MEFNCIGTGSSGNCYLINLDGSYILLDAGVRLEKVVKNINLNKLEFAFISHEHKDHSLIQKTLDFRGVKIVDGKLYDKFTKIENKGNLGTNISVYVFPIEHGECKNAGIIIKTANECVLYVTDFTVCKYDLSAFKFTSVIVECNYVKDKVRDNDSFIRTKENIYRHLSLDGCDLFLSKLNLSKCNEIILVHFSDNYSDPIYAGSYINNKYKIKTLCCRKNGGYDTYE